MQKDNVVRTRLSPNEQRKFEELMERLELTKIHGAESKTLRKALDLALKHLELKDKWF